MRNTQIHNPASTTDPARTDSTGGGAKGLQVAVVNSVDDAAWGLQGLRSAGNPLQGRHRAGT
jgi:hypothetical protein